jgi:hypothetical protein
MPDAATQDYVIKTDAKTFRIKADKGMEQDQVLALAAATNPEFAQVHSQIQARKSPEMQKSVAGYVPLPATMTSKDPKADAAKALKEMTVAAEKERSKSTLSKAFDVGTLALGAGGLSKMASLAKSGRVIGEVEQAAARIPVHTHEVTDLVKRAMELHSRVGGAPPVIKNLADVLANPRNAIANAGGQLLPMLGFKEARDFYGGLTKLSETDAKAITGPMKYQIQQIASKLGERIIEAASAVGKSKEMAKALKEYRQMAQFGRAIDAAIHAAITAGGYAAAYKILKNFIP